MDESEALVGEFVRMLMDNHRRSIPTRKQNVRALLKVKPKEMATLVESSKKYLVRLGLELVGIDKAGIVDLPVAEKYFVRRLRPSGDTAVWSEEEFRRLVMTFALVILEQGSVEMSRLWFFLQKTEMFQDEDDFSGFLKRAKDQGYLSSSKVEESLSIVLGWRYYCDLGSFSPREYFWNRRH
ncbi:hypothetical protein [Encephalitozoon cuniculi GB-M1]|uniref:Uncharacterized protein n=2 Tax=Encephalitozoon cuniculi TaxID=6035 RepID=Q8SVM2_ENCCU|nr:uncharacterized protein ECU05_0380 [Encephalitozoon cuniculi GB-M1]UYI27826.1 melanoma-associated antigen 3-like protein [Encephalitozoon cuniculi]CAD26555.2 hypothetical protein [Encephalitozoon cuniculi GB-M1]